MCMSVLVIEHLAIVIQRLWPWTDCTVSLPMHGAIIPVDSILNLSIYQTALLHYLRTERALSTVYLPLLEALQSVTQS